jgi:hypothetical protein
MGHLDKRTIRERCRDAALGWIWWGTLAGATKDGVELEDAVKMATDAKAGAETRYAEGHK